MKQFLALFSFIVAIILILFHFDILVPSQTPRNIVGNSCINQNDLSEDNYSKTGNCKTDISEIANEIQEQDKTPHRILLNLHEGQKFQLTSVNEIETSSEINSTTTKIHGIIKLYFEQEVTEIDNLNRIRIKTIITRVIARGTFNNEEFYYDTNNTDFDSVKYFSDQLGMEGVSYVTVYEKDGSVTDVTNFETLQNSFADRNSTIELLDSQALKSNFGIIMNAYSNELREIGDIWETDNVYYSTQPIKLQTQYKLADVDEDHYYLQLKDEGKCYEAKFAIPIKCTMEASTDIVINRYSGYLEKITKEQTINEKQLSSNNFENSENTEPTVIKQLTIKTNSKITISEIK